MVDWGAVLSIARCEALLSAMLGLNTFLVAVIRCLTRWLGGKRHWILLLVPIVAFLMVVKGAAHLVGAPAMCIPLGKLRTSMMVVVLCGGEASIAC